MLAWIIRKVAWVIGLGGRPVISLSPEITEEEESVMEPDKSVLDKMSLSGLRVEAIRLEKAITLCGHRSRLQQKEIDWLNQKGPSMLLGEQQAAASRVKELAKGIGVNENSMFSQGKYLETVKGLLALKQEANYDQLAEIIKPEDLAQLEREILTKRSEEASRSREFGSVLDAMDFETSSYDAQDSEVSKIMEGWQDKAMEPATVAAQDQVGNYSKQADVPAARNL